MAVYNSSFDVGDDAICLKSGKDEDGRRRGVPCENIVITNNIVYHGHGGVTVGSEMSGGVRNIHVSNCTFIGTDVGLRFKSNRGRGGVVENIFISDIRMADIPTNAISFNLYYGGMSVSEMMKRGGMENFAKEEPVTIETPQFKNIFISEIVVNGANQAVFLQGLPEMKLENVVLSDMLLESKNGFSIIDADNVQIERVKLITESETAIEFLNSKNAEVKDFEFQFDGEKVFTVNGKNSENIRLLLKNAIDVKTHTHIGTEVSEGAVVF